ncbi:alpha/beta fold hydrolase [Streptomyces sp. HD]|uniref:alpha/beta fold hydrolase n=1 Tax=Streptomyces sp. HD TaxID=3020892 RepID=UPI00232C7692|nr:alpha/beta fold hydrolase [Streptomyces sp. HD]MDC0768962.1 alpha/beta fold hydrolase [Streptomyces sp. HD]
MHRARLFPTSLGPADAPVLLLVHGWGGDGREWSPHAEALAGRFRVVVPDLRGHGRSEVPTTGNAPVEMADDLAALLGSLRTGPVIAVGHSMGGQVVNPLAVRHAQAVRSVIALDPAQGATGPKSRESRPGWRGTADMGPATLPSSWPAPSGRARRPVCVRHMSAPCSAPRTM